MHHFKYLFEYNQLVLVVHLCCKVYQMLHVYNIMCNYLRGHKHFLELAYSKHSVFKQMRLHEATQTDSGCFKVEIQTLVPTSLQA